MSVVGEIYAKGPRLTRPHEGFWRKIERATRPLLVCALSQEQFERFLRAFNVRAQDAIMIWQAKDLEARAMSNEIFLQELFLLPGWYRARWAKELWAQSTREYVQLLSKFDAVHISEDALSGLSVMDNLKQIA